MTLKKTNYTKEEASSIYLTNYRYKILKELQIEETQRKIKNKLLNIEEFEIDPVFYKFKCDERSMSELLSMEFENSKSNGNVKSTGNSKSNDDIKSNDYYNCYGFSSDIDSVNKSNNNNFEIVNGVKSNTDFKKNIEDNKFVDSVNENSDIKKRKENKTTHKNEVNILIQENLEKNFKKNKYVDLEAECSDEENSTDQLSDNSSFIDDTEINDDASTLFFTEKQKQEEKILKRLERKFKNVNKINKIKNIEIDTIDFDNNIDEDSSDIEKSDFMYDGDINFNKVEYENVEEESEDDKIEGIRFKNLDYF